MWRMTVRCPDLRLHFWKTLASTARHNPSALKPVLSLMVLYLHLGAFSRQLIRELDKQIDACKPDWQPRLPAPIGTPRFSARPGAATSAPAPQIRE